jgi:hypothetical protein
VTANDIARFALSDEGAIYRSVCEHWGIDPAAGLEDDVMAFNLRAALLITKPKPIEPEESVEGKVTTDLERVMERMSHA